MLLTDVSAGLQQQVRHALALPAERGSLRPGLSALGHMLDRLLRRMRELAVDPLFLLTRAGLRSRDLSDPLETLLEALSETHCDDAELLGRLDALLSVAWNDYYACYEAHQLHQAQALHEYLDEDDLLDWEGEDLEASLTQLPASSLGSADYPADEMETALRFRAMVWHVVSGLRATLGQQEHEGWMSFELALLLGEEMKRRAAQEQTWAAQELERATEAGDEDECSLWVQHARQHEARFLRWWQVYGPLHGWLAERLELCPSGMDRVFDAIGEDIWELSLLELLDLARDLLV